MFIKLSEMYFNTDTISCMFEYRDVTHINLTNGKSYTVSEKPEQILKKIRDEERAELYGMK